VRLLLDTHALIWTLGEPEKLSAQGREALTREDAEVATSIACLWEIAIKYGLGRFDVPPAVVAAGADEAGIDLLGLSVPDVVAVATLPRHHRDPFDRMLVAQALVGGWTLLTRDEALELYGAPVLRA
jgi:PIN domain nuclease of toxin-antitoxin system